MYIRHRVKVKPNLTGTELAKVLAALPRNITMVDLSSNHLYQLSGAELATALAALRGNIKTVNLGWNYLGGKTEAELATALAALPTNITTVNLSFNDLYQLSGAELATALAALRGNIKTVDLSSNNLYQLSGAELATALAVLRGNIKTVDLRWNHLGEKTGAELATALAALPTNITTVNLSFNELNQLSGAELATALAALRGNITTVDLGWNHLGEKTEAELAAGFSALPPNITSLSFHYDYSLSSMPAEKLATFLNMIPPTITRIDLRRNNFFTHKSPKERDQFLTVLGDLRHHGRLDLEDNGENELTRAMISRVALELKKKLPELALTQIFSYFTKDKKTEAQLLKHINYDSPDLKLFNTQAKLLGCIEKLTENETFWQPKVRFSNSHGRQLPKGIKQIKEIINNKNKLKTIECLKKVKEYAGSRYSQYFQIPHRYFRGRANETNDVYGILKNTNLNDTYSIGQTIHALEKLTAPASSKRIKP